jgi:acetylornithine/succinyldiaminopimelate/putrescine aminotransferase
MFPLLPVQAFAGIVTVSVGHCHPGVLKAIREQQDRLQHTTTIYLNDQVASYAKELTDTLPGDLKAFCPLPLGCLTDFREISFRKGWFSDICCGI